MKTLISLFTMCFCTVVLVSCSRTVYLATNTGGGSEITNGITAHIYKQDGTPALDARVFVRDRRFLKDTSRAGIASIPDAVTDESGYFKIDHLNPGTYYVEVNDGNRYAVLFACSTAAGLTQNIDLGSYTLQPAGSIQGTISSGAPIDAYIQIYGLDRVVRANPVSGEFFIDPVPSGIFTLRIASPSSPFPAADRDSVSVPQGDTVFIPFAEWNYSRKLFMNTTQTGAQVPNPVVNFPVLIRLTGSNFHFSEAKKHGEDIRFSKSYGIPLAFEIERWDSANALAEVWVTLDTVYGNDESHYITMSWGNPNAQSLSNSAAVFDTANGFQGVWHFAEDANALALDATVNHYDGSPYNMTAASAVQGAIGGAQHFNGASSYYQMAGTADSKLNFPQKGYYTLSAWVYADTLFPTDSTIDRVTQTIISKGDRQYNLDIDNANRWHMSEFQDKLGYDRIATPASPGAWKYVVGVRNGASLFLYVDGKLASSAMFTDTNSINVPRFTGNDVKIGRIADINGRYFDGAIDEARISSTVLSADWIKLCYMNQKQQDALVMFR